MKKYNYTEMAMKQDIKDVAHPICPINMFFEGDEDKCDVVKCDWDLFSRCCTMNCSQKERAKYLKRKPNFSLEELKILISGMNYLGYYRTPTLEEEALLAKLNSMIAEEEESLP